MHASIELLYKELRNRKLCKENRIIVYISISCFKIGPWFKMHSCILLNLLKNMQRYTILVSFVESFALL